MREPAGVPEHRYNPLAFAGCECAEVVHPDVAIVDVAQQRLQSLIVLTPFVEPPGHIERKISSVYRSRLAAIRMAWCCPRFFRIGQAAFVLQQLVQLPKDVLLDLRARLGSLRVVGRRLRLIESLFVARRISCKTPPASRRSTALTTCRCNRSRSCSNCTGKCATPGKHSLAFKADRVPQRHSICTSRSRAWPSDFVTRRIAFRQRLTFCRAKHCFEHANDAQPPRGDPGAMHELDVFRRAHSVQLLGKLPRLPTDILCGESSMGESIALNSIASKQIDRHGPDHVHPAIKISALRGGVSNCERFR